MRHLKRIGLDFLIDKLTNSIENTVSGDIFQTDISILSKDDIAAISQKNNWLFDWKKEFRNPQRDIYKLTIVNNQTKIQGLISLEIKTDHVYVHLIESSPFNKGSSKIYSGVPGNLIAFACKLSFQRGHEGYISFISKSQLIEHYIETLGATHIGGRIMIIDRTAALKLIDKYFGEVKL